MLKTIRHIIKMVLADVKNRVYTGGFLWSFFTE